ncbi:MAG: lmo0937 family membrane protein [Minisyncoccia bacterium]
MITTIVAVLVILWLLGMLTSFTVGGLIHILLVVAIIIVLLRIIRGEKIL